MQQHVTASAAASCQARCPLQSSSKLGSVACASSFRTGHVQRFSQRQNARFPRQHRKSQIVRAGLGDVGKYLSEAAAATFSPKADEVPWSGGTFSGKVSHHEGDVPRLKRLYKAVRETREQLAGCMDPNVGCCPHTVLSVSLQASPMLPLVQASNYDPNAVSDSGACTYLYEDPETGSKQKGSLGDFVGTTISSLFGNKGDTTGPNWEGSGYAYSGDIVSQRDIDRLVSIPNVFNVWQMESWWLNVHTVPGQTAFHFPCHSSLVARLLSTEALCNSWPLIPTFHQIMNDVYASAVAAEV